MLANGWASEGISFCTLQPAVVPFAAAGVWTGTTSLNERVRAVVVDDGRYYILYSSPGDTNDSGVWHGTATTDNAAFTTSNGRRFPIAQTEDTVAHTSAITLSEATSRTRRSTSRSRTRARARRAPRTSQGRTSRSPLGR
jgi:hypothetical protein